MGSLLQGLKRATPRMELLLVLLGLLSSAVGQQQFSPISLEDSQQHFQGLAQQQNPQQFQQQQQQFAQSPQLPAQQQFPSLQQLSQQQQQFSSQQKQFTTQQQPLPNQQQFPQQQQVAQGGQQATLPRQFNPTLSFDETPEHIRNFQRNLKPKVSMFVGQPFTCLLSLKTQYRAASNCSSPGFNSSLPSSLHRCPSSSPGFSPSNLLSSLPNSRSSLPSRPGFNSNNLTSSPSNQGSTIQLSRSCGQTDFSSLSSSDKSSSLNNNLRSSFSQIFSSRSSRRKATYSSLLSSALPLSQSSLPHRNPSSSLLSSSKVCLLKSDLQSRPGRGSVEVRLLQNHRC